MTKKILISTGGSGGHVIPAITMHDHLKENYDILISSDVRGLKYLDDKLGKKNRRTKCNDRLWLITEIMDKITKILFWIKFCFLFVNTAKWDLIGRISFS